MAFTSAKIRRLCLGIVAVAAVGLLVSSSYGGSLATTNFALNDGFGPDGGRWRGSAAINAGPVFGNDVVAVVDWAAFAPGKFQLYLTGEGILDPDPSGPMEVTYAYQIESVASANPGISTLSVGVDPGDARGSVLPPAVVSAGGASEKAPTSGADGVTQMQWNFIGNLVQAGDTTGILVFTSLFAPELDLLQISSGLASPNPSPLVASISDRIFEQEIPEPGTLALIFAGAIATLSARRQVL